MYSPHLGDHRPIWAITRIALTASRHLHGETVLLLNRVNRTVAFRVLQEIDASKVTTIVRVRQRDEQRSRAILRQYVSLTDATNFAIMERLGISRAFTLDRNFSQYGWELIGPTE